MAENKPSVLFVCLGNIIRSPTCEGLLRYMLGDQVFVDSAACTNDDIGQHPSKHAQTLAKQHGYDISKHVSKHVTKEDFNNFDIIVSLESYVARWLEKHKPEGSKAKIVPFASYDISNPWYGSLKDFKDMYKQIEKEMPKFIASNLPGMKILH